MVSSLFIRRILFTPLRGICYMFFYWIRYWPKLRRVKNQVDGIIATVVLGDISLPIWVYVREKGLSKDLYLCSMREYPQVFIFRRYVEDNKKSINTYIDIGSNIGFYEMYAARIFNNNKKNNIRFIAVEPVEGTLHRLRINLKLNKLDKTIISVRAAIGDRNGHAQISVPLTKNLARIITDSVSPVTDAVVEKVPMMTLKKLFATYKLPLHKVFFRWDVEGYEYTLVEANIDFLSKLQESHIVMEFHPFYLGVSKSIAFVKMLEKARFRLVKVVSCEPQYFLSVPQPLRRLLTKLFLLQYKGEALGEITKYRNAHDLVEDLKNPESALYYYPHLHLYFSQ